MKQWILVLMLLAQSGCSLPRIRPDSHAQKAFDAVDAIEVGEEQITDRALIMRLKAIHRESNWEPLPMTLPLDLIPIYGLENGSRRFKLVYGAGWLMDTDAKEQIVRIGKLSDEDREWIEANIRSLLPKNPNVI